MRKRAITGVVFLGAASASACGGADTAGIFTESTQSSGGQGGTGGGAGGAASTASGQGGDNTSSGTTTPSGGSTGSAGVRCGNGVKDAEEECDGTKLGGKSCSDLGYSNPAGLTCGADCKLRGAGCKATCGDSKVEPGEACDDSNTTSGDGCSATCATESLTCSGATPVKLELGTIKLPGSTVGGGAHGGAGCMKADGPDRIFAVSPASPGFLTASLTRSLTSFDSVLYVTQTCSDAGANNDLLCADSGVPNKDPLNGGEVVSLRVQPGTVYFVFVDGSDLEDAGDFELVLDLSLGTNCNDPIPIPLEPGGPMKFLGSTNDTGPSTTAGICGGVGVPDVVYQITRPDTGPLGIITDLAATTYNAVIYARTDCLNPLTELQCSSVATNGNASLQLADVQAKTPIFVWVDGATQGSGSGAGSYALVATP